MLRHALAFAPLAILAACGPAAVTPVAPPPAPVCPAVAPPSPAPVATTPAPVASAPSNAPAAPPPEPPPPPAALVRSLEAAEKAIAAGDGGQADAAIASAEAAAGEDAHLAYLVARMRATR
jgi:hypothetical protein